MSGWVEPSVATWLVELRRAFHRRPELAFEEKLTAGRIVEELESLGIPYRYDGEGKNDGKRTSRIHDTVLPLL